MSCYNPYKNKNKPAITKIPDKLRDMINSILSREKPNKTINSPIVPYRKVIDGIVYVLRTGYRWWKMPPKEYGSGSTCRRRF